MTEPIGLRDDPIPEKGLTTAQRRERKLMRNIKVDIAVLQNRRDYYMKVEPRTIQITDTINIINSTIRVLRNLKESRQ